MLKDFKVLVLLGLTESRHPNNLDLISRETLTDTNAIK